MSDAAVLVDREGPAAPPRANGELVFEAPWESRAFGVAVALCERRGYAWDTFRSRLIAEIAAWEARHAGEAGAEWSYYERWLASLERLLLDEGLVSVAELAARTAEVVHKAEHEHDGHYHHEARPT